MKFPANGNPVVVKLLLHKMPRKSWEISVSPTHFTLQAHFSGDFVKLEFHKERDRGISDKTTIYEWFKF